MKGSPFIQKNAIKLFGPMFKNWLATESFCRKILKAKSTSCVEGFNSTCYKTMNLIKGWFQTLSLRIL